MTRLLIRPALISLAVLAACAGDQPTDPAIASARGSNAAPLTATPGSLSLVIPSAATGTVTATVQFVGLITAETSDPDCATVSPHDVPASKPKGSAVYVATFTVTGQAAGSCMITLTDKQGRTATVAVEVREVPPIDGTRLLFDSFREGNYEIYTSNADGSDLVQITETAEHERHPVFFPDRSKIVYQSDRNGPRNLFMANADGSDPVQLTFYDFEEADGPSEPAVSPDGKQIAFVLFSGEGPGLHIYVMDAVAGATPVAVTAGNTLNRDPVFTPDGRIIYASAPYDPEHPSDVGYYSLWIMYANGASPTQITNSGGLHDLSPSVSPDGSTIAFTRRTSLALMDFDGGNLRVLESDKGRGSAVFSPDGKWLAFVQREGAWNEIMVMKVGAPPSSAINVTNTPEHEGQPDWR